MTRRTFFMGVLLIGALLLGGILTAQPAHFPVPATHYHGIAGGRGGING